MSEGIGRDLRAACRGGRQPVALVVGERGHARRQRRAEAVDVARRRDADGLRHAADPHGIQHVAVGCVGIGAGGCHRLVLPVVGSVVGITQAAVISGGAVEPVVRVVAQRLAVAGRNRIRDRLDVVGGIIALGEPIICERLPFRQP